MQKVDEAEPLYFTALYETFLSFVAPPSSDRKMRLRLEAENSALKSENENLKMRIEQLESEKSIKRKKCS